MMIKKNYMNQSKKNKVWERIGKNGLQANQLILHKDLAVLIMKLTESCLSFKVKVVNSNGLKLMNCLQESNLKRQIWIKEETSLDQQSKA